MLSPTARIASSSALIPICSWKSLVVSNGTHAPASPAASNKAHQGTRSSRRWAWPTRPGAYSRRPAERATHSSTPTPGPCGACASAAGGCCSVLMAPELDLLQRRPAEQALWTQDHHHDQDPEHDQVRVRGRDIAGDERFGDADQETPEHRARDRADAADDGGRERLQAGHES